MLVTFFRIESSDNSLQLDHFYLGIHLDKVLELPAQSRGKQIEAEFKMTEYYRGEKLEHEKQKTMKVLGPDCSFA